MKTRGFSRHIGAMSALFDWIWPRWLLMVLLTSAGMLAVAHAFQTFGGLAPCTLCLRQREVYWVALPVAALALLASGTRFKTVSAPWFGAALSLVFLTGAYIAVYHAGAEWRWWPGPTTCSGGAGGVSAVALGQLMAGAKIHAPSCDVAAWRFLGLSMAGWNALISLKLAILSGGWALHSHRTGRVAWARAA